MNPLVDSFGRQHTYLRLSITTECNLGCVYCKRRSGVSAGGGMPAEDILKLCGTLAGLGVRKVRLTGGEPLTSPDIERLISELTTVPQIESIAVTTNGVMLGATAKALKSAGLSAVNISLDSLRRDRFIQITGDDRLHDVLKSIDAALEAGISSVKLNAVVLAGMNDDELPDFVELTRDRPISVRFIEYMPFPGNPWQPEKLVQADDMMQAIRERYELVPTRVSGKADSSTSLGMTAVSSVAKTYAVPGYAGSVGFITPISHPFCASCNRLRITADGCLRTCLLRPEETDLRPALASDNEEELVSLIRETVSQKPWQHPPVECSAPSGRSMTCIGG